MSSVRAVLSEGLAAGFFAGRSPRGGGCGSGLGKGSHLCRRARAGIAASSSWRRSCSRPSGSGNASPSLLGPFPSSFSCPEELRWGEVEEITGDEYVAALIRRAVGYQLNIRL